VLPRVSADRRSLLLKVDHGFTPQPKAETIAFKQTTVIPDGRTMVVSLGKVMSEGRTVNSDVPILSKIPYVSRLVKTVGYGRETLEMFLLVTPRVIVNEEPEQTFVNTLPALPRP
jgi:general secretion pathway protein D